MTQQEIWETLHENQIDNALMKASSKWVSGVIKMDHLFFMPEIEDLNVPHWQIQPIVGKAPEEPFWYRLSRGIFNVNLRLREENQLAYLEERDLFHDCFGHLPILYDKQYTNYVRALGIFAQFMVDSDEARRALSNVYWFTSEFGLVMEDGQLRAYGAGVLSSQDELKYAMSDASTKVYMETDTNDIDHTLEEIASIEDYVTDGFQDCYYILNNWGQLDSIIRWLWFHYGRYHY